MSQGDLYWTRRRKRLCVDCGGKLPKDSGAVRCQRDLDDQRDRSHRADWAEAVRAQAAFEAEQKANLHARIRKAARDNPDLPLEALSERFGPSVSTISRLIGGCGPERRENAYMGFRRTA